MNEPTPTHMQAHKQPHKQPHTQDRPIHHPWLERYIWFLAVTTFMLIILGGTVTSKNAGLAVPDWPRTFGHNMLTYPPSQWVGGVRWEHTHRLLATFVGMLTLVLMGWVLLIQRLSMTIRILGAAILVLVIIQGVMGGLRVTEISTALGVVHGITGQLFFALIIITAVMTGKRWLQRPVNAQREAGASKPKRVGLSSFSFACIFLGVLVIQLTLGATMRHYRAGLAIPDFPTAYGQLVPPLTAKGIKQAMDAHAGGEQNLQGYFSPFKVSIHFAHRLWAITVVLTAIFLISILASRQQLKNPILLKLSMAIIGLLLVQVCLGAFVIWSGRYPEVATAHQATGALVLGVATVLMMNLKILPESRPAQKMIASTMSPSTTSNSQPQPNASMESES